MKKLLTASLLTATLLSAQSSFEITPVAGYNLTEGNLELDDYAVAGAEAQYNGFNSIISPELTFLYAQADYDEDFQKISTAVDTTIMRLFLNGVYEFKNMSAVIPSIKAGFGYEVMSDSDAGNSENSPVGDVSLALKLPFTEALSLKVETLYMVKYNDARYDSNAAFLAGLTLGFGGDSEEEDRVETMKSAEDTTQEQDIMMEDSIEDLQLLDSDNDGIIDNIDECPNTLAGLEVDASGCKLVQDSDGDGVEDYLDQCMNTPLDTIVDSNGCSTVAMEDELNSIILYFGYKYTELTEDSQKSLDRLVTLLNNNPAAKIELRGYTDSIASAAFNLNLSKQRAEKIKKMLIEQGIDAQRISTVGYGERNPIASNMEESGRAKNRRIEVKLLK